MILGLCKRAREVYRQPPIGEKDNVNTHRECHAQIFAPKVGHMSTANSIRRTDSICRTVVQLIFETFLGFTVCTGLSTWRFHSVRKVVGQASLLNVLTILKTCSSTRVGDVRTEETVWTEHPRTFCDRRVTHEHMSNVSREAPLCPSLSVQVPMSFIFLLQQTASPPSIPTSVYCPFPIPDVETKLSHTQVVFHTNWEKKLIVNDASANVQARMFMRGMRISSHEPRPWRRQAVYHLPNSHRTIRGACLKTVTTVQTNG